MGRVGRLVAVMLIVLGGAACGERQEATVADTTSAPSTTAVPAAEGTGLDLTAVDYGFEGIPQSVPAGPVTVTLTNEGAEEHQAVLVRLDDGVTPEQYTAAAAEDAAAAYGMLEGFGGPSPLAPGETVSATSVLTPGTYLALCFIPSPSDGTAHAAKGMVAAFEVTDTAATGELPEPDRVISANEFSFDVPSGFTGKGTFALDNAGQQSHELAIYRIEDGRTFADVEAFLASPPDQGPAGPPPMVAAGGIADVVPGGEATVDLDLPAGDYAFVCFLPDVTAEGAPHFTRGMLQPVTVR